MLQTVLSFLSPPQMAALCSWLPVWPTPLRPRSSSVPSLSRVSERWRKRTGRSGCSSANRRAPQPSLQMVTMETSSGEPRRTRDQRTGTTQRRRRTTTRSVPDRPASRSVRSGQETLQQLIRTDFTQIQRNLSNHFQLFRYLWRVVVQTSTLHLYNLIFNLWS